MKQTPLPPASTVRLERDATALVRAEAARRRAAADWRLKGTHATISALVSEAIRGYFGGAQNHEDGGGTPAAE